VREHLAPEGEVAQSILRDLGRREEEDGAKGDEGRVAQHRRRSAWVKAGCPYPPCLDPTDLARFDREMPRKDLVWDVQFVAKRLLESLPEGASERLVQQVVLDVAEDAPGEGVVHVELMAGFSPFAEGGDCRDAKGKWAALFRARRLALAVQPGLSLAFVVAMPSACRTQAHAEQLLEALRATEGYEAAAVAGVGYFCGEGRISSYEGALAAFREAGQRLVCIHAGEGEPSGGSGPEWVRRAVAVGAERVGHGIEAAADAALMEELRARRVCLEVCPLSNRALECCPCATSALPRAEGLGPGLAQHPLPRLLEAGVECCLSADDPLYWAGPTDNAHGLVREFRACREILGLDDAQLALLADASLVHASAPEEALQRGRAGILAWLGESA